MIKRSLLALAALAVLAAPTVASAKKEKDKPYGEKVICRTQTATGSRLPGERICKTRLEWERDRAESKRRMGELIEDRSSTVNTGG